MRTSFSHDPPEPLDPANEEKLRLAQLLQTGFHVQMKKNGTEGEWLQRWVKRTGETLSVWKTSALCAQKTRFLAFRRIDFKHGRQSCTRTLRTD